MATHDFLLPDVGEGLEAGTVVQWLVAPGQSVTVDQIIVEIETDKAVVEIPAPVTGVLVSHGGEAGATLPVGAVLATFETDAAASHEEAASPAPAAAVAEPVPANAPINAAVNNEATTETTHTTPGNPTARRTLASPATRKYARNHQVDLTLITGTGSRGQITQKDVEQYIAGTPQQVAAVTAPAAAPPMQSAGQPSTQPSGHGSEQTLEPAPAPAPVQSQTPAFTAHSHEPRTEPLSGLRKQIAVNMQAAWRDIPHVFTFEEIDASALAEARRELNEEIASTGNRISFLPFFVKACVIALRAHPRFNASLNMNDETVTYHGNCNIGIATATPEGLIVTVVHNAEQKSILQIGNEIATLAALARERRVSVEQIKGGTFTISNFGSYGGTLGTPIIRPPEVGIAGFGRIHDKVVARDGQPVVRKILPIAVSTDHRLNDGEHLGAFVSTLSRLLSNPVRMLGHL